MRERTLRGCQLKVSLCTETSGTSKTREASIFLHNNKLIVRNVAFEAKRKDILDLFKPFGNLNSLRIPRNYHGDHRGFFFVEMSSYEETETVLKTLNHTHFYGR